MFYDKYVKYNNKIFKMYGNGKPRNFMLELDDFMLEIIDLDTYNFPAIKIDNIVFYLICKIVTARDFCFVISCKDNEYNLLCFYKSVSEIGIWRFSPLTILDGIHVSKPVDVIIKGYHYLTSTFVHIELQNFLNLHYNILKNHIIYFNSSDIKNKDLIKFLNYLSYEQNAKIPRISALLNYNENANDRIIKDEYILFLDMCISGGCFNVKKMDYFINSIKDKTKENIIFFNKLMEKYIYDAKSEDDIISNTILYINSISKYMEEYYEVISEPVKIDNLRNYVDIIEKINVETETYSVKIRKKTLDFVYNVIYLVYNFNENKDKKYKIIVNLIPEPNEITEFGIYKYISSCGVYVSKPYEYKHQFFNSQAEKQYVFIGTYYNNMFPLNNILQ